MIEITGHRSEVRFLRYLRPDGNTIISSSFDSLVVWDAGTGEEIRRLIDGTRVYPFAVAPDGSNVLTVDQAGARIIDTATSEIVIPFDSGHAEKLFWAVWSPGAETIASVSGGSVHLWNPLTAELVRSIETGLRRPVRIAWSPDGSRIAAIGLEGTLVVFETSNGGRLFETEAHARRGSHQLAWSPNGEFVGTGGADGLVKIWDVADWALAHVLRGMSTVEIGFGPPGGGDSTTRQGLPISALAFSPDSRRIASADDSVRLWSVENGKELRRWYPDPDDSSYVPHYGTITDLEFDPHGTFLASSGLDATAKVWDSRNGTQIANVDRFFGAVEAVDWAPDGTRLAMSGADGASVVWNVMANEEEVRFEGHRRGTVLSVDFAPHVPRIVTAGGDGAVKVWYTGNGGLMFDLPPLDEGASPRTPAGRPARQVWYSPKSNRVLMRSDGPGGSILDVRTVSTEIGPLIRLHSQVATAAWSPDGRRVAAAAYGARILDFENLDTIPVLIDSAGDAEIEHVAWSRDGERLLTASESGAAIWDWMTGLKLFEVNPQEGASYAEEAPDGSLLLTIDGQFRVRRTQTWSLESQAEVAAFDRPGARVASARFLAGGKQVITTYSRDPVVHVWDSFTGQELFALAGHRSRVAGLAVSPDGKLIATASRDRTVRLWDAATGEQVAELGPRPGPVVGVKFSPDGRQVAAYGAGGVALWEPGLEF